MRSPATTTTHRPGPLQELPLEHFLPTNPAATPRARAHTYKSPPPSARKRPAASPLLLSPAKRRILADEGVFPAPATGATPRAPASPSGRFAPAHFDALLRGPRSPARRLDFGAPDQAGASAPADADATPRRRSERVKSRLASSPELPTRTAAAKPSSRASSASATSPSTSGSRHSTPAAGPSQPPASAAASYIPTTIPRELPPALDPQSAHHPGFDVHIDTHIPLPHVRDRLAASLASPAGDADAREREKENAAVRQRRVKKATTAPAGELPTLGGALISPRAADAARAKDGRARSATPRARMPVGDSVRFGTFATIMEEVGTIPGTSGAALSPARTPRERRAARRTLEDEVDEADGEDL